MFAIIEFKGKQYKVEKGQQIRVPYLKKHEEGSEIEISDILMLHDEKNTVIGKPVISRAKVIAEVKKHGKDKKIIVFKKKRRKGYRKKQGHRQKYSEILIKDII